ncbi:MAG: SspB family protein [Rhodothalassiaceae bacterium]
MSSSQIDYDDLVQKALRNVVRDILICTAKDGLPGDHHFYIAFRTRAPGVSMPEHLRERYPDEMTVVLQHKFWDLTVYEDRFKVGLSFNQQPETLVIPFSAIVGFVDPSVQFALQFQDPDLDEKTLPPDDEPDAADAAEAADPDPDPAPAEGSDGDGDGDGDNVVTLDAFRKKP